MLIEKRGVDHGIFYEGTGFLFFWVNLIIKMVNLLDRGLGRQNLVV